MNRNFEIFEEDPAELPEPEPAIGLDANRIRAATLERRALLRARAWGKATVIAGVVTAVALIIKVVQLLDTNPNDLRGYILLPGVFLAWRLIVRSRRRVVELNRSIERSQLADPDTEPDFSSLSDGSQVVDQLRLLTERRPPDA